MKFSILSLVLSVSFSAGVLAKTPSKNCHLYLATPKINGNYGNDSVNANVIRYLEDRGFLIVTDSVKANYTMYTSVMCGSVPMFFGALGCSTEIKFVNNDQSKVAYTDGPTMASMGMSINYQSLNFPKCSDL